MSSNKEFEQIFYTVINHQNSLIKQLLSRVNVLETEISLAKRRIDNIAPNDDL